MLVMLIDGNFMVHRHLHAGDFEDFENSKGLHTGAVFGAIKSIKANINQFKPDRVVCIFDAGISIRRREIYPPYKGPRYRDKDDPYYEELNDENKERIRKIVKSRKILTLLLKDMGVHVIRIPGWEADDLLYMIPQILSNNVYTIVSDDKDLIQCVDVGVSVYRPIAQELITVKNFFDIFECSKHWWNICKACNSDPSDNILGVSGIGPTTLKKLYNEIPIEYIDDYPFDNLISYCCDHTDWRVRKLAEESYQFLINYELMYIPFEKITDEVRDIITDTFNSRPNFDRQKTIDRFEQLEFKSILIEFGRFIAPFQSLR